MITAEQAAKQLIAGRGSADVTGRGRGEAPVNIALCKYWGKRCKVLNLPETSSLSVALPGLGAVTTVQAADCAEVVLNGARLPESSSACRRVLDYIRLFTDEPLRVESRSTVPLAAGLASSASGFAALALALNDYYGWGLTPKACSIAARLGSGSACRSVYDGFVEWQAGEQPDGSDSYAVALPEVWPDFCVGLLLVSKAQKPVGSREAMQRTCETSTLYRSWGAKVNENLAGIKAAIQARDMSRLGRQAESNALAMHATMMDSWPPVLYWLPESLAIIQQVHALRAEGLPLYFTMDAGPNVKLLFEKTVEADVRAVFPSVQVIHPFAPANNFAE